MCKTPSILKDFEMKLRDKNRSENTIHSYISDLIIMLQYMKKTKQSIDKEVQDIDIADIDVNFIKSITYDELSDYESYLTSIGNKSSTRARRLTSIKTFYEYLVKRRIIASIENIAKEIELPKIEKRQPKAMSLEQSENLLRSIDGRDKERDYCMINLFLNCGMRLSELVSINLSDISLDAETIHIVGKGNKERTIYLNTSALNSIKSYLKVRHDIQGEQALFLSKYDKRIDKRQVQRIVSKYMEKAGIDTKEFHTHSARHTAATLMYANGVNILEIQKLLGHENISTTQGYTHVDNKQLHDAVAKNPLANLGL